MQLRIIFVAACIFLLVLGIGYKFQEYQHLKTLVDTYESVLTDKLSFIEEFNNTTEEAHEQFKTYYSQKPDTPIEETLSNLDNIIRSAKLVQGYVQDYDKKLNQDREKFQNIKKSRLLLTDPVKGFSDKLLDSINNYYQEEIKTAKNNDVGSDFTINLYETLKDFHIALNHGKKSQRY